MRHGVPAVFPRRLVARPWPRRPRPLALGVELANRAALPAAPPRRDQVGRAVCAGPAVASAEKEPFRGLSRCPPTHALGATIQARIRLSGVTVHVTSRECPLPARRAESPEFSGPLPSNRNMQKGADAIT